MREGCTYQEQRLSECLTVLIDTGLLGKNCINGWSSWMLLSKCSLPSPYNAHENYVWIKTVLCLLEAADRMGRGIESVISFLPDRWYDHA